MKKFKFFIIIAFSLFLFNIGSTTYAEDDDTEDKTENVEDLEKKISDLENKLEETKNKGISLQREIDSFNSQISLTQLRIQQSLQAITKKENEITEIAGDIEDLKIRSVKLVSAIGVQENVLSERIRARYKTGEESPFVVVFGSDTINKIIQKTQYLKLMEKQDNKLLAQMNKTKKAYAIQQLLFEEKKEKEESLKTQLQIEKTNLERYNADLAGQKADKDRLLERTQNDESKFQDQLKEAQEELSQIIGAASALQNTDPRNVKKGELIGIQGNTGFSNGEHLHFGVYRYSSFEEISGWNWYYSNTVDPAKKLKSKTVYWNTGCSGSGNRSVGSGNWSWPLGSVTVSQGYGYTCWSNIYYGGKSHPAYDMYGPYGAPVYATADGKAYFCKNCLGDGANGVFIFHDNDYMTVYWHLR